MNGHRRFQTRGAPLAMLFLTGAGLIACTRTHDSTPTYGAASFDLVSLDEKAVHDLFIQEIVEPLRSWRFVPGTKRYFLITDFGDAGNTVWNYVKEYEVSNLGWKMTPGDSVLTPFIGTVTFTSRVSFGHLSDEPDIPPHRHTHRYVFKDDHWRLQDQHYRIKTVSADCLVGHLNKAAWRIEAICVDEAERLLMRPE